MTPLRQKKESKVTLEEDIPVLSLAPFTEKPKVIFNDVLLGSVQTKKLLIKNPTKSDVKVTQQKIIKN